MMSDNMMYFLLFIVTKIHVNTVDEKNTSCFNLFTQPDRCGDQKQSEDN